ncbi:MAG: hypothetical protein OEN01_01860 [Candidatus Krumholzibacteria bacterium]|nr:hypothetical protein [Candidatus Krumholzibacteria bacterium]
MSFKTRIAHFGLLFAVSLAFFFLARDNPFWYPDDFLYLDQAMDIHLSWKQLFTVAADQPSQPLVKLVFFVEYLLFGLDAWKFYLFNIVVHSINAFLVFQLVDTLIRNRHIAVLSSLLFACAVGNYGKAVMVVSGIGDLLITLMTLLTLRLYFMSELDKGGRVLSPWFFAAILCFLLTLLTKATSFGIIGCVFAFNVFFRAETKKPILNSKFLVITVIALIALVLKPVVGSDLAGQDELVFGVFNFLKNYASYLVRMVFPIHASKLIAHAGPVVQFVYQLATEIRVLIFLCIVSFTIFGFIFGNRTIRFFIAWTYITVTPFCFFRFPTDWLDIRHLYLVSVGFAMILASVTVLAAGLLHQKRWRRLLPYSLPLIFVFLSQFIISQLDRKYELTAELEPIQKLQSDVSRRHQEMSSRQP